MMKSVQKAAALALCVFGLGQGAQADEAYPLCQTSSGIPGLFFLNMVARVIGPARSKWAFQADAYSLETGFVPLDERTWQISGTGNITSLGIKVRPLALGPVEIAFYNEESTELLGLCRAEVVVFDQNIHGLDALRHDTCPLVGDIQTPLAIGETRELQRPSILGGYGMLGEDVISIERAAGNRQNVLVTGVGEGVATLSVSGRYSDPNRYDGFCAFVVTSD